jgi:hypothetical protein
MEEFRQSRLFSTDKASTNEFFKNSRVASCSHVIVKGGTSIAVPFQITNEKGLKLQNYKTSETMSGECKSMYRYIN